ncbi:transcription elongation factor GreA [Methylobrevis pamukkalensis]|uniref:Transcription elongation factor GreA n=1 Tax=Methylobrevis pamukkalensis TaxID=1439726 RepID=A0A1E3H2E4_9HYPH|nr:transcription elongation factor GreA [Methylobrevis pamukkalensis]ODN70498.1 Transcription elongation factor GreA [Methylobrevis pamukkalensis]
MSRAFTKEGGGSDAVDRMPDRPISPHRNLVTAEGLAALETEIARLDAALATARDAGDTDTAAAAARDLRYVTARRASAELVVYEEPATEVRFGATVTLERGDGRRQTFRIVGEDEADPAHGTLSHVSPLARALQGREAGEVVAFQDGEIEIIDVT